MNDFPWLVNGETPELSKLGERIAACIRKHGYTERTWAIQSIRLQVKDGGIARMLMSISHLDGKWQSSEWRPA